MLEYALRPAIMQKLSAHLNGELICPSDCRYEASRKVWNGMIEASPAALVYCADALDVVTAVQFARDHHLSVSVRSGGHSFSGSSVCEGGIVIDLSRMKGIWVTPEKQTAWAQAGLKLREFGLSPGLWACHDHRYRWRNWSGGPDPRWRPGLVDGQVRPHR